MAFRNRGNTYCQLGDFKAAKDYHDRHLKIAEETGGRSEEGVVYSSLGNAK